MVATRYPGVPVLLSKKDVSDAFKWIPVKSQDSRFFAADLPGGPFGAESPITIIYNSLTSGWCGAPGEYMLFAWVAKQAFHGHRPEDPTWQGSTPFKSFVLMDDTVLIEPLLGVRPWMASCTVEDCTRNTLGPSTLNEEKDLIEGKFEVEKLIWGLNYNTEKGTRSLPAVKLEKASHLLHLPHFDHGNRQIPLKLVQELRGNQQFWLAVMPSLGPLLQATNELLGPPDAEGYAVARGDEFEKERTWQRFWEAVELQRLLVDNRAVWEARFTHPLLESLSVEEMMALPGQRDKVVWASGDATLDRVSGIDWNAKKAFSCQVEPLKRALNQFIAEATHDAAAHDREEGSGFIISITELLAVVTLASLRAVEWKGQAVLYAGDNQNVIRWLAKRQARHPVATYLLQILAALEASESFRIFGAFLRTYHNVTADALTREDAEIVMSQKGLEELPGAEEALTTQLNRGWQKRALIWAGQDDADSRQALRLAERRHPTPMKSFSPEMKNLLGFRVVDVSEGLARYAKEGFTLGAQVFRSVDELEVSGSSPLGYFQSMESVGDESIRSLNRGVARARPKAVWIDVRTESAGKKVVSALQGSGWKLKLVQLSGRSLGDQTWWKRWVVVGAETEVPNIPCVEAIMEPITPIPKFFPEWFIPPSDGECVKGVVQLDPTMPYLGTLSPKPCGTILTEASKDQRKLIWDPRRPLPGLHPGSWDSHHKEPLLLFSGGKEGPRVKVITPQETCLLLDGKFGPKDIGEASSIAASSLIAAPIKLAQLGLRWLSLNCSHSTDQGGPHPEAEEAVARSAPGSPLGEKTGLCDLPWEDHTEETLRQWLKAQPKRGEEVMRVGGRRGGMSAEEAASKALSRVLRHEAGTETCPISPEGWVKWRDLLAHPLCCHHREDMLEWGVTHNSKDRFVAKQDAEGVWYAAAWSGHTITGVSGPSREVDPTQTPDVLVHGTYRQYMSPLYSVRG